MGASFLPRRHGRPFFSLLDCLGRILNTLREGPNGRDTIAVFWSDHGYHFGEKDHLHKFALWKGSRGILSLLGRAGPNEECLRIQSTEIHVETFSQSARLTSCESLPFNSRRSALKVADHSPQELFLHHPQNVIVSGITRQIPGFLGVFDQIE